MKKVQSFFILIVFTCFSFSQVFFSEYAEGSSNNKYLEIYNGTGETLDLSGYAYPSTANAPSVPGEYEYWNSFDEGASISPGDVYVICHGSADDFIQNECDENHTYLSNGDDGYCLVEGTESSFTLIDCIGTWDADPGDGWDVAGIANGTKDHTLVRKSTVLSGNYGDWFTSAGTSDADSEWLVYEQNTWDYLGYHSTDSSGDIYGCMDSSACNYNENATVDNGSCTYPDELFDCDGNCLVEVDECGVCGGNATIDDCASDLFFSEYAEGSSNHKYLEIYNGTAETIYLENYAFPNATNGANEAGVYDYWNTFDAGASIAPGDVYVICHGSADDIIQAECDQQHTYLSNGDDGFCLVEGDESSFVILDCIGTWEAEDPGNGWDVAGINDATKDHTLVRLSSVISGNYGDWFASAGTTAANSEWAVFEQNTWDYVGYHPHDFGDIAGCTDPTAGNYNPNATSDDGSCLYYQEVTITDIQGTGDTSPLEGALVQTTGIVTGVSYAGFFIQDGSGPWTGLWVYTNSPAVVEGNQVEVSGTVTEYNGLTEIEASLINILSTDNPLPEPIVLSTGDVSEQYEGVRVEFLNATCTELPNEYGEWQINDGSGHTIVDDRLSDLGIDLILEQGYDVIGVVDCYNDFKIQATEVSIDYVEGAPIAIAGDDLFVNYGDVVILYGDTSYDTDGGNIASYFWTQEEGVDVFFGESASPIISFIAPNEFTTIVFSLEVTDNSGLVSLPDYVSITVGSPSISDVQYAEDIGADCYDSSYLGEELTLTGTITAVRDFSSYPNFYFQQEGQNSWGGIYVYTPSNFQTFSIGDNVSITGIVNEYYGFTQLEPTANGDMPSVLNSSGNTITPLAISTSDLTECNSSSNTGESYEGMLVTVSSLVVDSIDEYGTWTVTDNNGYNYFIDDYMYNTSPVSFPNASIGSEFTSITGVVGYSYGLYRIYPRNIDDILGGDEIEYLDVTIAEIQSFEDEGSGDDCYSSILNDQYVNVTGTVTAVKADSEYPDFWIQDFSVPVLGGVYVYTSSDSETLYLGAEVNFNAEVDEYYGLTELKNISDLTILSSGNELVPSVISTGDLGTDCSSSGEVYEGMLVTFNNVAVESIDSEYNSIYVNDGTGIAKIDDYIFDGEFINPSVGDSIGQITGVVHYYFGEYVLYPRSVTDIISDNQECVANGDVNEDDVINVVDIVQMVNTILSMNPNLTEYEFCLLDLNIDGVINVVDIVMLVNTILG